MQCHELRAQLDHWRASAGTGHAFAIVVDDGEATFQKLEDGLLVSVALNPASPHEVAVEEVLRLAQPSLSRFPGALARSAADGRLWLMAQLPPAPHIDDLLDVLEALLNQRDTWQSILDKTQRPTQAPVARRPLHGPLLGTGIRHA